MECLVEAKARIDVAREFVGLSDDRLESCADECIAMGLTSGQGAGISA